VGNVDTEMGFYLTQYNFIVLFWFLRVLNVSRESSSGVSGHKIRPMTPSHMDTEKSKCIWKKGANAIVYIRYSLCETIKTAYTSWKCKGTDVRILLKGTVRK
jgi:hypothetical protein